MLGQFSLDLLALLQKRQNGMNYGYFQLEELLSQVSKCPMHRKPMKEDWKVKQSAIFTHEIRGQLWFMHITVLHPGLRFRQHLAMTEAVVQRLVYKCQPTKCQPWINVKYSTWCLQVQYCQLIQVSLILKSVQSTHYKHVSDALILNRVCCAGDPGDSLTIQNKKFSPFHTKFSKNLCKEPM